MKALVLSVLFGFVLTVSLANPINQQDAFWLVFLFFFFFAVTVYLCVAQTSKMVKNFAPILHNKYWGNPKKETDI